MNKLYLLTSEFPFGQGESFLWAELVVLKRFFSVIIIPQKSNLQCCSEFDACSLKILEGVEIYMKHTDEKFSFISVLCEFFKVDFYAELNKDLNVSFPFVGLYTLAKFLAGYRLVKKKLASVVYEHAISAESSATFYSYWSMESAYALSKLKCHFPKIKLVARCHRMDLYREARIGSYMPVNKRFLNSFDNVVSISKHGADYLVDNYHIDACKVYVSRLGVVDHHHLNVPQKNTAVHLVSCSFLVPVKRLDLLIVALEDLQQHTDKKIIWTHFGDGPLRDKLVSLAGELLDAIDVQWMGAVTNDVVMRFYAENDVDAFINVSGSEGIPVSIMEAHSFGVPVIATNVGGVSEIVDDSNGVLLDRNFVSGDLVSAIMYLVETDTYEKRVGIKQKWMNKYNAEMNYIDFCRQYLCVDELLDSID